MLRSGPAWNLGTDLWPARRFHVVKIGLSDSLPEISFFLSFSSPPPPPPPLFPSLSVWTKQKTNPTLYSFYSASALLQFPGSFLRQSCYFPYFFARRCVQCYFFISTSLLFGQVSVGFTPMGTHLHWPPPPPPQPSLRGRTTKAGIADGQRSPPLFQKLITQTSHFIQPLSFILFLSFLIITCSSYISLWCITQILTVLFLCCTRNIRLPLLHGFTFLSLLGAGLLFLLLFLYFTLRNLTCYFAAVTDFASSLTGQHPYILYSFFAEEQLFYWKYSSVFLSAFCGFTFFSVLGPRFPPPLVYLAKLTIYSAALTVHCHLRQARWQCAAVRAAIDPMGLDFSTTVGIFPRRNINSHVHY